MRLLPHTVWYTHYYMRHALLPQDFVKKFNIDIMTKGKRGYDDFFDDWDERNIKYAELID